jgi:hypothetical protein
MKVRLGQEETRTLSRDACADITYHLVRAQCGTEFANFLSAAERLEAAAKAKSTRRIPLYDIRAGLSTAVNAAKVANQKLVAGSLADKALVVSKKAAKMLTKYKGDGLLPPEGLPALRRNVEGLRNEIRDLVEEVRKNCRL